MAEWTEGKLRNTSPQLPPAAAWLTTAKQADTVEAAWTEFSKFWKSIGFSNLCMMRQVPRFQSELPTNRLGHLISQEWTHFLGRNPARAAEASMSNACSRGQDVVFNPRQVLAAVRSTGFTVVGIERMIDFGMQGGWAFPVVDYTSDTFDVISFDCRDQLTEQSALMESLGSSVKHAVAFFLEGLLLRDLEAELVQQPLSEREQEAINWVALGYRTKGVAEVMGIAQSTANEHLTAAMFKLHAATRPQAAARAGLLNLTS